ncbi:MAG: Gfo/Idh/MocA family oxidoreductase [Planctomycetes bacterium]|nr:Gfo/Idh/MocA family oxidoreductase [Planctomycetota bacterium]
MGISVGMVGVGSFGSAFVELYQKHPQVDRVALCDLNAERLVQKAKQFGIEETYPSLEAVCESDLDALSIITQHWLHGPQCIQAMEAGKHVYSAVPPVYSHDNPDEALDLCDKLVETAERTGMKYMFGETTFFRPETMFCRQKAAAGEFGNFVYAEGEYFHDLSHGLVDVAKNRWGDRFGPDKTGGIPMFYPTHSTGGVLSIMGAHVTHVSAQGYQNPGDDWWREDTLSGNLFCDEIALYRLSNGATMRHAEMRRLATPCQETFRIYGTEGSFESDFGGQRWLTTEGVEEVDTTAFREPIPDELAEDLGGHGGSHAYLVHEFVDSIVNDRLPRINVWQAVRFMAPGLMAHKSALAGGELLEVPDWGDPLE